jgi:phospholipid/cholesterol/gamma-HCH transport system permease protein
MFKGLLNFVAAAGDLGIFGAKATRELFRPPFEIGEWSRQILDLGSRSIPLIVVAGLALGVVMAMDARTSLGRFGGQGLVPAAVAIGMFRVLNWEECASLNKSTLWKRSL